MKNHSAAEAAAAKAHAQGKEGGDEKPLGS
jgi:hypothetical protein